MTSDGQRSAAVSGDAPAPTAVQAPTPQLRALLLCDLAIESLGDRADPGEASALVREHDHLVRELLAAHGGFEADKTDGFLALFERPIHAVAFALAYQRRLRALHQGLAGRVGIHVGDVVTWTNNSEDVKLGARRVEVEGLAKPVTARLMHLARPGQILLSSIAMALAQRAESELDPPPGGVRWQHHGPYRFKGVPAPMVVHEVGEAGVAALKAPPSDDKAVRDTPWWRRPAALVAETLAVLAVVVAAILLSSRPQPAIAFIERDWVVVGDLRNMTGAPGLTEALDVAFRISLEQSRHVNVLSDLKVRDTLRRMQRAPGTPLDRETGAEIALREGARALILPSVAEVGGRVRVSAEVVDPNTLTTVYAESHDGVGVESTLRSMDRVTGALRARLGETLKAIETDSEPLPEVVTGSLEALQAYAAGLRAYERRDVESARDSFAAAVRLDERFALAHVGLARVAFRSGAPSLALDYLRRASASYGHLPPRDRLYLDAWLASFASTRDALERWRLYSDLYPDQFAGSYNFALTAWMAGVEMESALAMLERSDRSENALRSGTHFLQGTILMGLDRMEAAGERFHEAMASGQIRAPVAYAQWLAAQRRYDEIPALLQLEQQVGPAEQAVMDRLGIAMAIDKGRLRDAHESAQRALLQADTLGSTQYHTSRAVALTTAFLAVGGDAMRGDARSVLDGWLAELTTLPSFERHHAACMALLVADLAAQAGALESAGATLAAVTAFADAQQTPELVRLLAVVEARLHLMRGEPKAALDHLPAHGADGDSYLARAVALEALAALGEYESALAAADWLASRRGRAWGEWGSYYAMQPLKVAISNLAYLRAAEISAQNARQDEARAYLSRFLDHWPEARDNPSLEKRIERVEVGLQASSL